MVADKKPTLRDVVGGPAYRTWVDMLARLVPDGRTHRLAPMIAGMLQYAAIKAGESESESDVAEALLRAGDAYEEEEVSDLLLPIIDQLFADAGVTHRRTNARGRGYSIASEALYQFAHWYDMPWEA